MNITGFADPGRLRHGWDHETGMPDICLFGDAVQVWAIAQEREMDVTVGDAAAAFRVSPDLIRQAAKAHPTMFLDGERIDHDGS